MILKATVEDLPVLHQLARVVANNMHELGIDQWSDTYPAYENFKSDMEKGALFVFKHQDQLLGSITLLPQNDPYYVQLSWDSNHSAVIHRLMVDPKAMRQHIGTLLMEFAILKAKQDGYETIKTDTHPDNFRMHKLILSCGFQLRGYMTGFHRNGYERKL